MLNYDLSHIRILVIGDSILDKYYYGEVNRISPEAPVPINHILKTEEKLGGAANVANSLRVLGCKVSIITHIGNDNNGQVLLNLFSDINIFPIRTDQKTTTKVRIIGNNQQMLRLDFEEQLNNLNEKLIVNIINQQINTHDIVIISDYNKGFCTNKICQNTINTCNILNKLVIIDPKGNDWNKYQRANYITPNLAELSEAISHKVINDDSVIEENAKILIDKLNLEGLLVTRSARGLSIINHNDIFHIPVYTALDVVDPTGAGDTVIAVFTLAKALNMPNYDAAYLANRAASITVMKVGAYSPSKEEINKI